jgi:hypothetical protein
MRKTPLIVSLVAIAPVLAPSEAEARGLVYCTQTKNFPVPIVNRPGQYSDVWHDQSYTVTKVTESDLTGEEFLDAYRAQEGEFLYETLTKDANDERIRYGCSGSDGSYASGGYFAVVQYSYDSFGIRSTRITVGYGNNSRQALANATSVGSGWGRRFGIEDGYRVLERGQF